MADLLIVDDDADLSQLLEHVLRVEGHVARVARNGRDGLRLVAERTPDAVLLDVEMPLMSGPEMAYLMFLRDLGDETIPLILVSGIVDLTRVAARVGTPYFLAKPYSAEAILSLVRRVLRERTPPNPGGETWPH